MEEYGPSVEVTFNFSDCLENFLFDVITHQKAEKLEFFVKNKNLVQKFSKMSILLFWKKFVYYIKKSRTHFWASNPNWFWQIVNLDYYNFSVYPKSFFFFLYIYSSKESKHFLRVLKKKWKTRFLSNHVKYLFLQMLSQNM